MARLDSGRREDVRQAAGTAGRFGLATRGVLYGLVGVLAVNVAHGDHGSQPDPPGALRTVADAPFGRFLLGALAVGFALLAVWHAARVWRGRTVESDRRPVNRLIEAGRAIVAAVLCVLAGRLVLSPQSEGEQQEQRQQEGASDVFDLPGGQWLVAAAGVAAIAFGLWQLQKSSDPGDTGRGRLSPTARRFVVVVRRVGYAGRALAAALIGGFLINAARTYDPEEATGLDVALTELAQTTYGSWLTTIVGAGLITFGAHLVLEAIYAPEGEV